MSIAHSCKTMIMRLLWRFAQFHKADLSRSSLSQPHTALVTKQITGLDSWQQPGWQCHSQKMVSTEIATPDLPAVPPGLLRLFTAVSNQAWEKAKGPRETGNYSARPAPPSCASRRSRSSSSTSLSSRSSSSKSASSSSVSSCPRAADAAEPGRKHTYIHQICQEIYQIYRMDDFLSLTYT